MEKLFAVIPVLLLGTGIASADPITITMDARSTSALAQLDVAGQADQQTAEQGPGDALQASATAAIGPNVAEAIAGLVSSIGDPAHLAGSGHALAAFDTAGEGQASAVARFAVELMLDQPFAYTFDGAFAVSDFPTHSTPGGTNQARWTAVLSSGSTDWIDASATTAALLHDSGVLPAGLYSLAIDTASSGFFGRAGTVDEDSRFDFSLGLTPVSPTPEPSAFALLAIGIGGFTLAKAGGHHRSRRSSPQ
jgi:hypothetical protein